MTQPIHEEPANTEPVTPGHEWYCDGVPCLSADLCRTATFDAPLTFVALSTGDVEACDVFLL